MAPLWSPFDADIAVPLPTPIFDGEGESDGELKAPDGIELGVSLGVSLGETCKLGDDVDVIICVGFGVGVCVFVSVGVGEFDLDCLAVDVGDGVCDWEARVP